MGRLSCHVLVGVRNVLGLIISSVFTGRTRQSLARIRRVWPLAARWIEARNHFLDRKQQC